MQHGNKNKASALRRVTIAVSVTLAAVVMAALVFWHREHEPEYQGKKLSEWVSLNARRTMTYAPLPPGTNVYAAWPPRRKAGTLVGTGDDPEEALRHFGTNALPWMIRAVQYQRPRWKARLWALAHFLPVSKSQQRSWSRAALSDMMRGNDVVSAFHTLGDVATPAIPELSRLMFASKDEQVSRRAMQSLAGIGTPAVPALSRALTNFAAADESFRYNAVEALAEMEMQALPAVPMLIQWLQNTNKEVAAIAVTALGELALWPNIVVPALTNKLQDPVLRRDVIEALGSFEKDGAPAIPHLLSFLTDTNAETVSGAASALGDIGEEADTVTPALAKLLTEHSDEMVRGAAAASLSQFGDRARAAFPILRAASEHPNKDVREAAAAVLGELIVQSPAGSFPADAAQQK
jgi:HEAT repeat protein